ncbi:DUF6283 family protein [Streptomyces sp. NRRL F-5053]|uniref:DUF6283 family protein n=1 Tax=Streptomyces sp. NRRL F-5053 TaxID=1463854 RepID=UPI001F2F44E2|nr:DUF6283 family protein [Streptomyces sp. NRRL F-5053]
MTGTPESSGDAVKTGVYRSDTEHDRRVRAHLAVVAAASGTTVDALLDQIDTALTTGRHPRIPPQAAPEAESDARPTIVRTLPADDEWGVTTITGCTPAAQPRPCGGAHPTTGDEPCPWRRDAPRGQFPAEAYRQSAHTSYPNTNNAFACHSSTPERLKVCAGWLLRAGHHNPHIQKRLESGDLTFPELPAGIELYTDYREMAIANGVAPDDPFLELCGADDTTSTTDPEHPTAEQ